MLNAIEKPIHLEQWVADVSPGTHHGRGISSARFVIGLLIILSLAAVTYGSLAFFWAKFSRAEVFFAECAREMIAKGNFITPLYHNEPFFDKPIFVYWLIIAMFKSLGVHHFAARIPSIVASLITITSVALAGSYLFCRRVGLTAAFMLGSAFMYLSFSTLCMSDMFLVMFDTLSLICIYAGINWTERRTIVWWLAAISMGLAFLTKGPVGVVLPAGAGLIYLGLCGKLNLLKPKHIALAAITIAIIASPWFYAAYLNNGPIALVHFFVRENIERFTGITYDAHRPFWYIIAALFLGFAPWSILLPPALLEFYRNIRESNAKLMGDIKVKADLTYYEIKPARVSLKLFPLLPFELSAELFLWIWLFIAVGFFCFSHGKCDYYTIPAYPAAAILVAHFACTKLEAYLPYCKAIALSIFISAIAFAAFILPQINHLVPVDKYAAIINKGPENLRVGIDNSLASWVDEILFQSGKDPQTLAGLDQVHKFIAENEPFILLVPEDKYYALSARQRNGLRVVAHDRVATHSLTPGYVIGRAGNIIDSVPLIVATNIKESK